MAENDERADDGAAARAFADLHAEVAVMRKAVESLPALVEELAAPNYAPSFGAIAKSLANVDARLAGIEGHPALKVSAEAHGQALARIVAGAADQATRALRGEVDAMGHERRALAEIVGHARAQDEQKQARIWTIGSARWRGLCCSRCLARSRQAEGFGRCWRPGVLLGGKPGFRSCRRAIRSPRARSPPPRGS